MFHLMPYRDLPADFERRYNSAYIDPSWFDVADSEKVGQYYNATLDEMLYAANAGLHGLCTNQHHQTSMASWQIQASWARCSRGKPMARISRSSSSARRCLLRRRRRALRKSMRCSTASAADGWLQDFPLDCPPTPP